MSALDPFIQRTHVAYLSMEIALRAEMHTYAGGLGVLAGDMARSSADLELPIVFVSLISRAGYVRQDIDSHGRQVTQADPWQPKDWTEPLDAMVAVTIEGREVWIRPWLYHLTCPRGDCIPVLLLDTDLDQNRADDREITHHLYGGDETYRLKQEIVLGIGGPRVCKRSGSRSRSTTSTRAMQRFLRLIYCVSSNESRTVFPQAILSMITHKCESAACSRHTRQLKRASTDFPMHWSSRRSEITLILPS
jgi:glucan phosphorylase